MSFDSTWMRIAVLWQGWEETHLSLWRMSNLNGIKLFGFVKKVLFRGHLVTMNNGDSSENECAFFMSIDNNAEVVPGACRPLYQALLNHVTCKSLSLLLKGISRSRFDQTLCHFGSSSTTPSLIISFSHICQFSFLYLMKILHHPLVCFSYKYPQSAVPIQTSLSKMLEVSFLTLELYLPEYSWNNQK